MTQYVPRNGAPAALYYKTDDQSVLPLVQEPVTVPIHLPLTFTFASRGDHEDAYLVAGDSAFAMYGNDVFDYDTSFATFNTPFAKLFNENANPQLMQRLVPDDAERATLRFYVEVVTENVDIWQRDEFGDVMYDANGKKISTGTLPGVRLIWRKSAFPVGFGHKLGAVYQGTLKNLDGSSSRIYPILDLPCAWYGKAGSNIGAYLSCPNAKSENPIDPQMITMLGSRVYTLRWGERATEADSPVYLRTTSGATSVDFSFKQKAFYKPLQQNFDYRQVVLKAYRNMNPGLGLVPTLGPVKDFYVYEANLKLVMGAVAQATGKPDLIANPYLTDVFSGMDPYGISYDGVIIDDGANGGEIMNEDHIHYMLGGSDGTTDAATFDMLVRREMEVFGEGKVNYLNMQRYPCKFLWDSGFSVETKKVMTRFMGVRPDTITMLTTHAYDQGINDLAAETSMSIALASYLRAFPESTRYGTPAIRGAVVGHSYYLNDTSWTERVPCIYTLAKFMSRYAGSGEGRFNATYRFDRGELAIVDDGYDINLTYKTPDAYANDWDYGLITIRSFDTNRFMFSAARSIYSNDRSVCAGLLTATVIADCEQVAGRVWAEMTGAQTLTEGQLEKMYEDKIIQKTTNKYDTVATITADAYHTEVDRANGYSCTVDIGLAGNKMHTVAKYTIRATTAQDATS